MRAHSKADRRTLNPECILVVHVFGPSACLLRSYSFGFRGCVSQDASQSKAVAIVGISEVREEESKGEIERQREHSEIEREQSAHTPRAFINMLVISAYL